MEADMRWRSAGSWKTLAVCGMTAGALLVTSRASDASTLVSLVDGNSTVDICVAGCASDQHGAINWLVDGTDYLYQEWFWYRADGSVSFDGNTHELDGTLV